MSTTPNLGMLLPDVGVTLSPTWASEIVGAFNVVDAHDHSSGGGVRIPTAGLNINADLDISGYNVFGVRTVRLDTQTIDPVNATDRAIVYNLGGDLYYKNTAGAAVQITTGSTLAGTSGSISGLASPASASFSSATFTFQSASLTPAFMAVGPLIIGRNTASSKTVTLTPDAAQPTNYSLTFPPSLPASTNYATLSSSGAISFNASGATGAGAVVQATSPTLVTPTLTGPTLVSPIITASAVAQTGTSSGGVVLSVQNTSNGAGAYTAFRLLNDVGSGTRSIDINYYSSASSGGERGLIGTTGAFPFQFITNNTPKGSISASGAWVLGAAAGVEAHAVNGSLAVTGSVTGNFLALNMDNASAGTLQVNRGGTGVVTATGGGPVVKQSGATLDTTILSGSVAVTGPAVFSSIHAYGTASWSGASHVAAAGETFFVYTGSGSTGLTLPTSSNLISGTFATVKHGGTGGGNLAVSVGSGTTLFESISLNVGQGKTLAYIGTVWYVVGAF